MTVANRSLLVSVERVTEMSEKLDDKNDGFVVETMNEATHAEFKQQEQEGTISFPMNPMRDNLLYEGFCPVNKDNGSGWWDLFQKVGGTGQYPSIATRVENGKLRIDLLSVDTEEAVKQQLAACRVSLSIVVPPDAENATHLFWDSGRIRCLISYLAKLQCTIREPSPSVNDTHVI